MTRPLAVVALLVLPALASAQVGTSSPSGPAVIGGRLVSGPPIVSGDSALFPVWTAEPPRFSVGGGSLSGYPQVWLPSGPWGGVNYPQPIYLNSVQPAPISGKAANVRPTTMSPQIAWSGPAEATLVVQFPAAAEVWVGGKKRDADPTAEWTLASPALAVGGSYKFEVKGRWKTGGKTFEASWSVAVAAGDRTRWLVVSGTGVK